MAPISSGSSTWTSSGLPFSFVSMATGIGPSSSGSQATVASVVTSTLLAGLGFSGGVISSFPSSAWPSLRPPTQTPPTTAEQAAPTTTPENAQNQGSDDNTGGEKNVKVEGEEGERDGEEEEEKDEEEDKGEEGKTVKNAPDDVQTQMNSSADQEPPTTAPDSTAKEKGGRKKEDKTAPSTVPQGTQTERTDDIEEATVIPSTEPAIVGNDSVVLQPPEAPPKGGKDRSQWPFSFHTGEYESRMNSLAPSSSITKITQAQRTCSIKG